MRLSYKTIVIGEHTGYGNASRLLTGALKGRGVEILPGSDLQLNFCMPPDYEFSDGFTIGYTPWESTEVPKNWAAGLRAVDDLWVTSEFVKDVFQSQRKNRLHDIFVLPHGIEECWKPRQTKHLYNGKRPFTFLHVGEPAVRKGGDILLQAWHKAFKDRTDVRLIFKVSKYPACRVKDKSGSIIGSPELYDNVKTFSHIMTQEEMLSMYHSADCMVYPTRGEGFGLIPWEAMASGLPTIIPYEGVSEVVRDFTSLTLANSRWVDCVDQRIHPGKWLDHDVDEVISMMEEVIEHYDQHSRYAFRMAEALHDRYSWDSIAEQAIDRINLVVN